MNATTNRARYRALQIASGMARETFRAETMRLAHELADGEDIEVAHILTAAAEISGYARADRQEVACA